MKLQCELCKDIVLADFVVDGEGIAVHCPSCGGHFRAGATHAHPAPAAKAAATEADRPPSPGPTMACPKCGTVQPEAAACRVCGLRAERMASYAAQNPAGNAAPELLAAWAVVEAGWDDVDAHDKLGNLIASHNAYAWAARRYRDRLRAAPDDPIATDRLARITRITEASLRASAVARSDARSDGMPASVAKPYRGVITVLIMLVVVIAAGTIYALASTSSSQSDLAPIPVEPARH